MLALLEPVFSSQDRLLHLQEGALTVSVFFSLERIFIAMSSYSPFAPDSRLILQNRMTARRPYLPRRRASSESGLVAARAKNPSFGFVCLLSNTELDHLRRSTDSYSNGRTRGRRSPHCRSQVPAPGHPTPSQTKGSIQQAASS